MIKRHLALFIRDFSGGGAERVMLTLASGFVAAEHSVDVIVCAGTGPLVSEVPDGVRVVNLGNCRLRTSAWPLARYLRRECPDCLLSAGAMADCVAVWARRLARSSTKVILGLHNAPAISPRGRMRFLPILMRRSYPFADGWVAVSHGVAEGFVAHIGLKREEICTIYNPVVTETLLTKSNEDVNHPWFGAGQPPVILGVGRLTRQKDFPNLIRAFIDVRQRVMARLLILGEGPDRPQLEALAKETSFADDIALPGFVDNPYAYMRSARVFVLSSLWEGLPTVLIEALACGARVVSTDCPSGPSEIIRVAGDGYLVPPRCSSSLAKAIYSALNEVDGIREPDLSAFHDDAAILSYLSFIDSRCKTLVSG